MAGVWLKIREIFVACYESWGPLWRLQLASAPLSSALLSLKSPNVICFFCGYGYRCCYHSSRFGRKWRTATKISSRALDVILKRGVVPKIHPSMPSLNCPSWRRRKRQQGWLTDALPWLNFKRDVFVLLWHSILGLLYFESQCSKRLKRFDVIQKI